jgi:thioredoxin 1
LDGGLSRKVQLITKCSLPRGGTSDSTIRDNVGGVDTVPSLENGTSTKESQRELTLDEKVHAAMKKLGLDPPPPISTTAHDAIEAPSERSEDSIAVESSSLEPLIVDGTNISDDKTDLDNCTDGICELPRGNNTSIDEIEIQKDPSTLADNISKKMKVDLNMAWAALGATSVATENNTRIYNEQAACDMIQMELDMISQIQEDSEDVQLLVAEGYDSFFVRRALAFADRNVEDARAILLADKMDEEEEAAAESAKIEQANIAARTEEKKKIESSFKTVNVEAGFDPSKIGTKQQEPTIPKAASRESVIFEATAAQIQELVLESPVPVLLDIYADWCGPCKALSPILEDMAVKSGGTLRLVKVNSDNERAVSQALEVTALPTIFGLRDGKILHMFQGMPKSEEMMKNFLMGLLIPGHSFNPPVTESQQQKYKELSTKLMKVAATASFSFSARERLQDRITTHIENLVQQVGNVFDAEQSVVTIRSLLSNIIRDPYEEKFRTINLSNKVIATKVAKYPACIAILKSNGFAKSESTMVIGKGKGFVNVAPLTVTRDAIDKWIDRTRYEVAREARKRRDEEDRVRIQAELAATKELDANNVDGANNTDEEIDPDACFIKLRIDGKKKVHDIALHADNPLSTIIDRLPNESKNVIGEVIITCVAKRLVVKSTDDVAMSKSFRQHGLVPTANIVVKLPDRLEATMATNSSSTGSNKLIDRVASKKKLKKGTHTMQSIGVYSTEDNAKGELIDGGGGTWYEHDVDDDEEDSKVEVDRSSKGQAKGDDEQNFDVEEQEVSKQSLDEDEIVKKR